ncbi:MAG: Sec-independent protein translocase subunit TatA/TatB [Candidatus Limnocylindrales bacterium]
MSPTHLIIVLAVALLILGPGKLPETGEALGNAVREPRRAMADEPTARSPGTTDRPAATRAAADAVMIATMGTNGGATPES